MVNIEQDDNGYPFVKCMGENCGEHIHWNGQVWFLSDDGYESDGFCSLKCLMSWVGKNIQDDMVDTLEDCRWKGGEE